MKTINKPSLLNRAFTLSVGLIVALHFSETASGLQLISASNLVIPSSASAGGASSSPIISADGRWVAFASTAANLVPGTNPTNGGGALVYPHFNVFLRDRQAGTCTLVSPSIDGRGGNGDSFPAEISSNGQFVLFESAASDLVPADTNQTTDIFLRDVLNETTTLISVGLDGTAGNGRSRNARMSADARYVVFASAATNLVASDTNGIVDVFLRDRTSNNTLLISSGATAPIGATSASLRRFFSESPSITPDGRFVEFYSTAMNLVTNGNGATNGNIYVRDVVAGSTLWASTNAQALYLVVTNNAKTVSFNAVMSADGRYVAYEVCSNVFGGFFSKGLVVRQDMQSGWVDLVASNASVFLSAFESINNLDMTADGRFIVYVAATNGGTAVYEWDSQTTNSVLVSPNLGGGVSSNTLSEMPSLDDSGRYVGFLSTASDLTTNGLSGDTNNYRLYMRDTASNNTLLAGCDLGPNGIVVNPATTPQFDRAARFAVLESDVDNLATNDNNAEIDVFVTDFASNRTALVSVRDGQMASQTLPGYNRGNSLCVSTNGRYAAFSSAAALMPGNTNVGQNIYQHDLVSGSNVLVSVNTNGAGGNAASWECSISGVGRYVVFSSFASDLVAGDTNKTEDIFLRDTISGTTILESIALNGAPGTGASYSPTFSADGRYILFWSAAGNISADTSSNAKLLFRDTGLGTNYLLGLQGPVSLAAMTPDGKRVLLAGTDSSSSTRGAIWVWDTQSAHNIYATTNTLLNSTIRAIGINPAGSIAAYVQTNALWALDVAAKTNWLIRDSSSSAGVSNAPLRFSADGRFLTYIYATNGVQDVFLYDFLTGSNILASAGWSSTGASMAPDISANGRYVTYRTSATNSVVPDLNGAGDAVLYDRLAGTSMLLSVGVAGRAGNQRSGAPLFSGNGQILLFSSWASDLAANDFNNSGDFFAFRLPGTDMDNDGMDDQWELDHFGTLARNGTGDFDGDGASDLYEFQTGTDPTDPNSVFRAVLATNGSGGVRLRWPAGVLRPYKVQYLDSLTNSTWQDFTGAVSISNGQGTAQDNSGTNQIERYYRIVIEP